MTLTWPTHGARRDDLSQRTPSPDLARRQPSRRRNRSFAGDCIRRSPAPAHQPVGRQRAERRLAHPAGATSGRKPCWVRHRPRGSATCSGRPSSPRTAWAQVVRSPPRSSPRLRLMAPRFWPCRALMQARQPPSSRCRMIPWMVCAESQRSACIRSSSPLQPTRPFATSMI